jgi:hypothetical protein
MKYLHRLLVAASAAFFFACSPVSAQWQCPDHSIPTGRGAGTGFKCAAPTATGGAFVSNGVASDPSFTLTPTWTGLHTFNEGLSIASNKNLALQAGTGVVDFSNGTTVSRRISDGSLVLTSQSGQIQSEDLLNLLSSGGVNGTSSTPLLLGVTNGNTTTNPITSHATPTVLISRIENIVDNHSHLGEDGPSLLASTTTFGGATQQAIAIVGNAFAQSTAVADVVGVQGKATQSGSGGTNTAYGGFFLGEASTSGSGSIGVQLQNSNNTSHNKAYVPSTFFSDGPFIVSLDVAYASTTASTGQANILLRSAAALSMSALRS